MSLNSEPPPPPPPGRGADLLLLGLILGGSAWEWRPGYLPECKPVLSFLAVFICGQDHNTAQLEKLGKVAGLINWHTCSSLHQEPADSPQLTLSAPGAPLGTVLRCSRGRRW